MPQTLSSSLEDYLECMYDLSLKDGFARTSAVSRSLKVSKPSVSSAVKALAARGLVQQEPYGYIRLTAEGLRAGKEITGRHSLLKDFLISVLGMREADAERDACRAEHALSPEALCRFSGLCVFLKSPARRSVLAAVKRSVAGACRL
jgi:DtxR family Mn-dependent transcriptional regulator